GTAGGIAEQALPLIAPMGRDLGIGMQGNALHAGTARTGARGHLAQVATAGAKAPDVLASSLAKGEARLSRGGQATGELGSVIDQRIIAGGHRRVEVRRQVSPPPP